MRAFVAVLGYAARLAVPRRRLLMLLPPAGGLLFGLLARTSDLSAEEAYRTVTAVALHTVVLPLTCLVLGDGVLGAEIRSGAFALTWLSPVSRGLVVTGRWLGAWLVAVLLLLPATVLATLAAGVPQWMGAAVFAVCAGAATYLAVFVALSAALRRAIVWSLLLVVLVEPVLGGLSDRVAGLSPQWLSLTTLTGLVGAQSRDGVPAGWGAALRLAVLTLLALALATWSIRRMREGAREG